MAELAQIHPKSPNHDDAYRATAKSQEDADFTNFDRCLTRDMIELCQRLVAIPPVVGKSI